MTQSTENAPWPLAVLTLLAGAMLIAIAAGWLTVDPNDVHAPMWVIGAVGLVFAGAGLLMLLGPESMLHHWLAALMLAGFAAVGIWATLISDLQNLQGGLPFVSQETNVLFARGLFGFGAVISLALCGYAIKLALASREASSS